MEAPILLFSSIPNLLSFFIFYLIIYLIAYFIIFPSWKPKLRPEASSCVISFFHGTPAVFLAVTSLLADPDRNFHSPNTPFQNMVLDYSIAYFLMDLTHYLIFYPSDVLFIGHHLATLFVFVTCRYMVYHGAYAILVLLILAEVTSFVQNTWTLANARKSDVEFAAKMYTLLSPPFYVLYSLVRGVTKQVMSWQDELEWACVNAKGRGVSATLYRMCLAAVVYQVWIERNRRIFQSKSTPAQVIIRKIVQEIFVRGSRCPRLARRLEELNFYP